MCLLSVLSCDRPGKAHASAVAAVVPEDSSGDNLTEGLQHLFQLSLIHRQRQVGNVKVCGVLLLLLLRDRKRNCENFTSQKEQKKKAKTQITHFIFTGKRMSQNTDFTQVLVKGTLGLSKHF